MKSQVFNFDVISTDMDNVENAAERKSRVETPTPFLCGINTVCIFSRGPLKSLRPSLTFLALHELFAGPVFVPVT
jgi:hypothetical protein